MTASAFVTALSTLAIATSASATTLFLPSAADLDLDGDGSPEITLTSGFSSRQAGIFTRSESFVVVNAHGSFQFLTKPGKTGAARQQVGSLVAASPTEGVWGENPPDSESASILYSTVISDPETGFSSLTFNFDFPHDLGFRFEAADGTTHYGWLRLRPPGDTIGRAVITTLHYNDEPGYPVIVGTFIPEPSPLTHLAIAISSALTRRHRRR